MSITSKVHCAFSQSIPLPTPRPQLICFLSLEISFAFSRILYKWNDRESTLLNLTSGAWNSVCFFKNKFYLLIYFWLCWVFVAAHRLSLVAASGGYSSSQCVGFSLRWLLLLRSTGSRHKGFSSCGTRAQ